MKNPTTQRPNAFGLGGVLSFAMICCNCSSADLDRSNAKAAIEQNPVILRNYAMAISDAQFDCAVKKGLYEPAGASGLDGYSRVSEKGRGLGYRDIGKVGSRQGAIETDDPDLLRHWMLDFAENAKFKVVVDSIAGMTDGRQPGTKIVTAKVRVKLTDACFPEPLKIWHIGDASKADAAYPFTFRHFDDGWRLEQ